MSLGIRLKVGIGRRSWVTPFPSLGGSHAFRRQERSNHGSSSSNHPPPGKRKLRPPTTLPKKREKVEEVAVSMPHDGIEIQGGKRAFVGADFTLHKGDHLCVVGPNGGGKTYFWRALALSARQGKEGGGGDGNAAGSGSGDKQFSFMSFNMHRSFVGEHGARAVCDVLGGANDPLARQLIVQLGLYPVWYKRVHVLSTGEIRKVLLAYVLSRSPKILVLDKPYDGLDTPSRLNLNMILSQLCLGFPRLLVDLGITKKIDRTELVLITHRHEEIPYEVQKVVGVKDLDIDFQGSLKSLQTVVRRQLSHTKQLRHQLHPKDHHHDHHHHHHYHEENVRLPSSFRPQVLPADVRGNERAKDTNATLLEMKGVRVQKDDYVILTGVDWKVERGQCWLLKGLNGAGKSTLVKLIQNTFESRVSRGIGGGEGEGEVASLAHEGQVRLSTPHLGLVSTEVHLSLAERLKDWTLDQVILSGLQGFSPHEAFLPRHQAMLQEWGEILHLTHLLSHGRHFGHLSQGQQKLGIIARALIGAPPLIIMDETCQGLDSRNRARVLSLLDTISGVAKWGAMIHVTHHDDEALESATHILDVVKGKVDYLGEREHYPKLTPLRSTAPPH